MDYLTQYYKNRAEQLQQELEQLTEAVLAKGDPGYYENETTNMGIGDWFTKAALSATIKAELRLLIKNLNPAQLADEAFMRTWMQRSLTAAQRVAWKEMFPLATRVGDGFNGVPGRIYWMFMDGKRMRVLFWDEASQSWKIPTKSGNSPFGRYTNESDIWKPTTESGANAVSSVITGVGGNPMTTGINTGLSSTSNKNDRLV